MSQWNMRRCLKSIDELALEMQNAYYEQKASMDEMIKQVSLLTDIMKGIQEDRARSRVDEEWADEESVREPEDRGLSSSEHELEAPLERQEEVRTAETKQAEEESQVEEEPVATPLENETSQEMPEEARDEPQEEKEEVIKHRVGLSATLFYLQARKVQVLGEKVERFASGVEGENAQAARPPPVIDKPDGCCEKEIPRLKDKRPERKAARQIYCEKSEPWPEPPKVEKLSDPGLRPKENKKIQGTYKNHKKKRGIVMVKYPRKNRWTGRTAKRRVFSGSPVEYCSHNGLPTPELIKLDENSESLGPVTARMVTETE